MSATTKVPKRHDAMENFCRDETKPPKQVPRQLAFRSFKSKSRSGARHEKLGSGYL